MSNRGGAVRQVLAWLGHPVTVAAVLVLAVNDHVLKQAYPGPVTGKLSDLAGLLVAPPLLALALAPALGAHRAAGWASALTGVGFMLVKCTAAGAALASQVWTALYGPSTVLEDPTDLAALPALALGWWLWSRARERPVRWRAVGAAVLLPLTLLTVCASGEDGPTASATVSAHLGAATVETGLGDYVSTDGGASWLPQRWAHAAPKTSDCLPGTPAHCFRVTGRPRVEESLDGGAHWTVCWQLSDGRVRFLTRQNYWGESPARPQVPASLAVVPAVDGFAVIVGDGKDGLLIRRPDGHWEQAGWKGVGSLWEVEPLTSLGAGIRAELELALAAGAFAVVLGYAMAVRRPDRLRAAVVRGAAVLAWALATLLGIGGAGVGVRTIVAVPGVLCAALLTWHLPGIGPRNHVLLLGASVLTALATAAPFVGWSVAAPDSYTTAAALSAAAFLAGLTLSALAARTVARRTANPAGTPTPGPTPGAPAEPAITWL